MTARRPYFYLALKIRTMFPKYAPKIQSTPPRMSYRPQESHIPPRKSVAALDVIPCAYDALISCVTSKGIDYRDFTEDMLKKLHF